MIVLLSNRGLRREHVTCSLDRPDEFTFEAAVDLCPQPTDMRLDDIGRWLEVKVPDHF